MAAGALLELNPNVANAVDEAIATARHAFVAGVRQLWVPQFYDFDAISLAGMREHLTVLTSIQADGAVNFHGQEIYVAAMGPRALQVTGELADGTLPHLAGPARSRSSSRRRSPRSPR
jgi:hypothetical protein